MACEKCYLEATVMQLRTDFDREIKKASESREKIYNRLNKLDAERARTDERYYNISRDLEELKKQNLSVLTKIEELSNQPAKRWNTAVTGLVGSVIGAIVGFASQKLFGG